MKLILLKSRNNINLLFDALKTAKEQNVTPLNIHISHKIILSDFDFEIYKINLLSPNKFITPYCNDSFYYHDFFHCIEITSPNSTFSIINYYSTRTIPLYTTIFSY